MGRISVDTPRLAPKQLIFLQEYAKGQSIENATKAAGYSRSSAPQMAKRTLKNPLGIKYLQDLQASSRAITAYDLSTAMQESLEVIQFAKERGQAMAYFKAVEHRAKLSGLLFEQHRVETIDLTGALQAAKERSLIHLNRLPHHTAQATEVSTSALPCPDPVPAPE